MAFRMSSAASIAEGILPLSVAVMLASHPSSCIWSPRYYSDLEFLMTVFPIIIGLISASFSISVLDFCCPMTKYRDLMVLARICLDSNNRPTSFAPFLASSIVRFIFAMLSWKIKLFSSTSPILTEQIPFVILSTPHPIFRDVARAAAKLPWPIPFIICCPVCFPQRG